MKKEISSKKKSVAFKNGDYTGVNDKHGKPIHLGDTVKITIGKPNNGYRVIFEAGAFCFTGGQVGICSFIKFRDELISGTITGKPIYAPFESFLEIVSNKNSNTPIVPIGTGSNYNQSKPSGGFL